MRISPLGMFTILTLLLFITFHSFAMDIACLLQSSAGVEIKENNTIGVNTSSTENISVTIQNVGNATATMDHTYLLTLISKGSGAYHYRQISDWLITWSYFEKTNAIVYSKIREFPGSGLPDSYMMIGKCGSK